jgi:hypothetical protein
LGAGRLAGEEGYRYSPVLNLKLTWELGVI